MSAPGADTVVLVPAAGRGERFGAAEPKALVELAGEPLLCHALRSALRSQNVVGVVVAAPPDALDAMTRLCREVHAGSAPLLAVVPGGADRQTSVGLAFAAAERFDVPWSVGLVHDAARALASAALFDRVIHSVREGHDVVVPVLPVVDTLRRVDSSGDIVETLDRSTLRSVQTPQGLSRGALRRVYSSTPVVGPEPSAGVAQLTITDDAGLAERAGYRIHTVPGEASALKITYPPDLRLAEGFLADPSLGSVR